jgi:putative ABC transport system permease protein
MLRNYLLISLRNIIRHSSISFINILGLSIGLACTMFVYLWVTHELSFDRFHVNAGRVYLVEEDQHYSNGIYHVNVTPWPSGPVWKDKIPEIEQACRITYTGSLLFRKNEKAFYEDKCVAVDSTFFLLFSFKLLQGEAHSMLKEPNSIVINNEMAKKYFGNENPIGKSLQVNNSEVFLVTGVVQKMPSNSSLDFDFLLPFDYMKKSNWYSDNWGNNSIMTYVMLHKNTNPIPVNKKLTAVVREHEPEGKTDFLLDPFTNLHLYMYWGYGHTPGAILNVWIFSFIALLVLVIACINFMNLSTARSASRGKEIGLRKVTGANRKNLIYQFFSESLAMSFLAMLIAFAIVAVLLTPFNLISGKEFHETDLCRPSFIIGTLLITLFTGVLAGTYPAIVLSAFKPVKTMKGDFSQGAKSGLFRKITVVIQFTLTIVLLTGTIVIYRQLHYMQSQKLGYDKENLLYVQMRGDMKKSYSTLREELLREPFIKSIAASTHPPHQIGSNSGDAWWEGKPIDMTTLIGESGVDFDYVETMGIEMKSGRPFSRSFSIDTPHDTSSTFLINEQMEKLMGTNNAVGAQLKFMGVRGPIVGVMKDYHYHSMRSKIEPLAITITSSDYWGFIYIRIKPGDTHETVKLLEKSWNKIMPAYPFDYRFVDEEFDKMYRVEERMGTLMNYFSALAILIACIGLFGLAAFTVEQKTREVGIRKALGAPIFSILYLFTWEFIRLLLISALISFPLAWYLLSSYLKNYSYHTQLSAWIFAGSAFVALLVALLAISYQALRAVRTNPATTLKYE